MVKYLMEADSLEVSSTAMEVTPTFIEVHKYIIFHASCRKLRNSMEVAGRFNGTYFLRPWK